MVYVPNKSAKKQQTNNLTLLKSPYLRLTADQNHIHSRYFLVYIGLTAATSSASSHYMVPVKRPYWMITQVLQKTICSKLPDLVLQCVRAPKTLTAQVLTQTVAKQSY